MATEVIFPRVDMDMASGQISRWFVEEGESIEKGEPLFEIETDKAAMEIEAPASGVVTAIHATGVEATVGTTVGWIVAPGEDFDAPSQSGGSDEESDGQPTQGEAETGEPQPPTGVGEEQAEPEARDRPRPSSDPDGGNGVRATPLARRLARQQGIDLASLTGSGPRGRIQACDLPTEADAPSNEVAAPAAASSPPAREAVSARDARTRDDRPARTQTQGALNSVWLREGDGDPLLLIHGFGADLNGWRPLVQALSDSRPVLAFDLPGHGGSPLEDRADVDAVVDALESAVTAAGVGRVHLIGHSLGAALAVLLAERGTVDVASLLLLSPAGLGPDMNGAFLDGFVRAESAASLGPWMALLVGDGQTLPAAVVRATARTRAEGSVASEQARVADTLFPDGTQAFSVRGALEGLAMPVRVVFGAADRIIPAHHSTAVPGFVGVHRLPGVGHMPHVEARDLVARIVRDLVRSAA